MPSGFFSTVRWPVAEADETVAIVTGCTERLCQLTQEKDRKDRPVPGNGVKCNSLNRDKKERSERETDEAGELCLTTGTGTNHVTEESHVF